MENGMAGRRKVRRDNPAATGEAPTGEAPTGADPHGAPPARPIDDDVEDIIALAQALPARGPGGGPPIERRILDATVALLGGAAGLGQRADSVLDLERAVAHGFQPHAVEALQRAGFRRDELERLVVPWRTWQRRRQERGRLTAAESNAAERLARLLARAEHTLGDRAAALEWLRTPKAVLGERAPLDVAVSDVGARLVEERLIAADYGDVA
jgi:putative toxin-antitoxin system antitoxin component (TIGR02293 family)